MIATFISALTSRIAGPIASGLALLLFGLALWLGAGKEVQEHRAEVALKALGVAQTDLTRCQDNGRKLEGSLRAQSAAVEGLKAEASLRTAAAEKAVGEALKGRASAEARAAKLLSRPPAGVDACARAMSAFEAVKESTR